ncbi:CRISPR-associated helicase Cas3' [Maridesulfovibrio sp.]|uniref:CRISPR-associated helicase Cas3' n=1 Tax=Maridesulfovibrio sp. TaxID=2795000 RepID=UPI0039EE848C
MFYAHTKAGVDENEWQLLDDHLIGVAKLASKFSAIFGGSDWGELVGKFHDYGKFKPDFQKKLHSNSNVIVDHKSIGARLVSDNLGQAGKLLSFCIAGHHGGLPDSTHRDLGESLDDILDKAGPYIDSVPELSSTFAPEKLPFTFTSVFQLSFFTRMLFSALVDADFLDTERYMDPEKFSKRESGPDLSVLYEALNKRISIFEPDTYINKLRCEILDHCLESAERDPGLFTLTVPTGGGKTLTSMAFALKHALKHGMRRVIYVIPYTSIIEQNAHVFKQIFPPGSVIEHHSNFDSSKLKDEEEIPSADLKHRLACENWDAPIVVTTNVQFFESLFAAKPSRCRKLHNLAGSVVILDEAQMLPVEYLKPCMRGLEELVENYNSSVVLCTATQPALQKSENFTDGLEIAAELAPDPDRMHREFKRTKLHDKGVLSLDEVAQEICGKDQGLCIVNTRARAAELFSKIKDEPGAAHLSALMCPAHRSEVLTDIRAKLASGKPCRIVSTQLIEAGVDVSFPVVIRELAGLDSIAQAAGRCNREGELPGMGQVSVFEPAEGLASHFRQAAGNAQNTLRLFPEDSFSPDAMYHFFADTYWLKSDKLDKKNVLGDLDSNKMKWDFRTAARKFRLIENEMVPVIVKYNDKAEKLLRDLVFADFPAAILRKLQQFTVQVYTHQFAALNDMGAIEIVDESYAVLVDESLYDFEAGLLVPGDISDDNFIF